MSKTRVSNPSKEISVQVDQWQSDLVSDEIVPALSDMAELEDRKIEIETALLTAKLLLEVTDGDWKQSEGIAKVVTHFFEKNQSSRGEVILE